MNIDNKNKHFCDRYRARVEQSPYRVNKVKNIPITFTKSEAIADPALDFEYEQMIALHMPVAQFHALVEHSVAGVFASLAAAQAYLSGPEGSNCYLDSDAGEEVQELEHRRD